MKDIIESMKELEWLINSEGAVLTEAEKSEIRAICKQLLRSLL